MPSEELIAGFKNALDRNQSIDDAKKSFINAGYKESEINEAAENALQGTSAIIHTQASQTEETNLPLKKVDPKADQKQIKPKGKKHASRKKIIILSLVLAIVLLGLGASLYFLL